MTESICKVCKFYISENRENHNEEAYTLSYGECRRYPKAMSTYSYPGQKYDQYGGRHEGIMTGSMAVFPQVNEDDWCGEWRER